MLLKNADAFLPLKKDSIKSIAVIGPLANSALGLVRRYTSLCGYALEGIRMAFGPNVKVNYAGG